MLHPCVTAALGTALVPGGLETDGTGLGDTVGIVDGAPDGIIDGLPDSVLLECHNDDTEGAMLGPVDGRMRDG